MKKHLAIMLLAIACALCTAFGLTACHKQSGEHTHEWGEWTVTSPATCESDGEETRVCLSDASHTETRPVNSTGHDWDEGTVTTPATCEENGEKLFTCSRNSSHTKTEPVDKLGHDWDEGTITTPATCEADGVKTFTCSRNSSHTKTGPVDKLGHDWNEGTVTTPATCESDGEKLFTCSRNSSHTKTERVDKSGHRWDEGTVTNPATCTESGTKTYHCLNANCTNNLRTEEILPLNHEYGEWTSNNTHHWKECVRGDSTIERGFHNFGTKGKCGVCGTVAEPSDLSFRLSDDSRYYTVTGLAGEVNADIIIPAEYMNIPVTAIADEAFTGFAGIVNVIIPDSVTSIGSYAFANCRDLVDITIGSSVASIGSSAFNGCNSLTSAYYTGDVAGWCAITFENPSANPLYNTKNFYIKNKIATELTIPASVTEIKRYAFAYCDSITTVTIESGVTYIAANAFYYCRNLSDITIPASVTEISNRAFSGCSNLTNVYYTGDIADWCAIIFASNDSNPLYHADNLYINNVFIKGELTIPEGISNICDYAFYNYSNITGITVPDSVTEIGNAAFQGCNRIASVHYTGNIAGWCNVVFADAYSNPLYYAAELYANGTLVEGDLIIPDGVTGIGKYAFENYRRLTSVTLSDDVTVIGVSAFEYCSGLTSVTIGSGVTSIENYAFSDCLKLAEVYNLSKLNIQKGATAHGRVGYYALDVYTSKEATSKITTDSNGYIFYDDGESTYLLGYTGNETALTLPADFNGKPYAIYQNAFYNYSRLTSVIIPDSVTGIQASAFSGCSGLKSITLPFVGGSKQATTPSGSTLFGYIFGTAAYEGGTATRQYFGSGNNSQTYYIPRSLNRVTVTGGKILYGAFYSCGNLTDITLPDAITDIADYAFYGCSRLTVAIPENVTRIGSYAFYGCNGVKEMTIPEGLSDIESFAFQNCKVLTELTIPASIANIGFNAFSGCDGLIDVRFTGDVADWCQIAFGNANANPLNYANNLYINGELITKLIIPDGVTSIGNYAFYSYLNLTSVTIGSGVTGIGTGAFQNCFKLVEVYNLSRLTVTHNNTLGYVGSYTLDIYTNKGAASKLTTDGDGYIFYDDGAVVYLLGYTGSDTELTLPSGLNGNNYDIYEYAFARLKKITSVTIPASVMSFGNYAFQNCHSLTTVYWNATECTRAGSSSSPVFNNCTGLERVIIGDNVEYIPANAFYNCDTLSSVIIGSGVAEIDNNAFHNCNGLIDVYYTGDIVSWCEIVFANSSANPLYFAENLYIGSKLIEGALIIPDNVSSIGDYAFYEYRNITSVTIGSGVAGIGHSAFAGCDSLTSVYWNAENCAVAGGSSTPVFGDCQSLKTVILGESVTAIPAYAFYSCGNLTSITIPASVTDIGNYAFVDCFKLVEVYNLSGLNIQKGSESNGYVGYYALIVNTDKNQTSRITQTDDGYIFYDDGEITYLLGYTGGDTELILPDGFKGKNYAIYRQAFENCTALTAVSIPDSVTGIGANAFYNCTGLKEITIPDSVTYVGNYAFYNCSSLESAVIGNGVKSVGDNAFRNCGNLSSVTIGGNVTDLGIYTFYNCNNLTAVSIPDSVTAIGNFAFYNCESLKTVILGRGIKSIGDSAFESCLSLTGLVIPDGVLALGSHAFRNCNRLTSVIIPDSVTSLGTYAFSNCAALTSVTIGNGVTDIGDYAFNNCGNLQRVFYGGNAAKWQEIAVGGNNEALTNATVYYYSESNPFADGVTDGNFWHYVNGEISVWEKE